MRNWWRAVLLIAGVALVGGPSRALAEPASDPSALEPCPYDPPEIAAALGVAVAEQQRADMTSPEGREVGCAYLLAGSSMTLYVRQSWDAAKAEGGGDSDEEPIPGDPDGGRWRTGRGPEKRLELHYKRGRVAVKVVLHGGGFREEDAKPRLLKLKRVPK